MRAPYPTISRHMSIAYPYKHKTIEEGLIPDPTIKLSLKTNSGIRRFDFLVDSGADTTTIPIKMAEDFMGFSAKTAQRELISGIEGKGIDAYPSSIEILFGNNFYKVRCVIIRSKVIPLLGRLDIWDKFTIIFDNMEEEVVFEKV